MQQQPFDFMLPKVEWKLPKISELPSWANAKRIAFDVETKDPQLRELGPGNFRPGNHICGVSVAIEDGPDFYLPMRHEGGDNVNVEHALQYLRDNAKGFKGTLVGTNLGYDLGFGQQDGIFFDPYEVNYFDVANAAVILYELHFKYSLDAIAERYGIPGKRHEILEQYASAYKISPSEMYKLPGRAAEAYGRQDVRLPLTIARKQERELEDAVNPATGLSLYDGIWKTESQVLPILVKLRERGVRVNTTKIQRVRAWACHRAQEMLDKVRALCGVTVRFDQVWEAGTMAHAMRAAGVKVPLTDKKKDSIKGDWLEKQGEVGKCLARSRDYSKLVQFADRTMRYQINGRVHTVFHQLRNTKDDGEAKGARYGRFSGEHYNIQQEPARDDEFGEMWRDIYEPEHGEFWVCSDWSQQEPRIAVHYAEKLGLPGAAEFANEYRTNAKLDCHQMLADLTNIPRKIVKNYFNGCIYGMGEAKLCRAIGHPTQIVNRNGKILEVPGETGGIIIRQFKAGVPWVSLLTREAAKRAEKMGVVWTAGGRRCNFPKSPTGNGYDWVHKAFSRIGQGSAADQMKMTLVASDRAGIPVRLIVHDEFDYSTSSVKMVKELKQLQMDTLKFSVPMNVDAEIGTSWGKVRKISELEEKGELDAYLKEILP